MRAARVAPVFFLFGMSVAALKASDSKLDRETLRGVKSIYVVVSMAADEDLKGSEVQATLVATLRSAGVKITDVDRTTLQLPCLFVNTNILKLRDGSVFYEVSVSLNQEVTVVANGRSYMAPTWSASTLAHAAATETAGFVRTDITSLVERFVRAYLDANPH